MTAEDFARPEIALDDAGPDTISLPEAPPALRSDLAAGRAVAWSEAVPIRTYEAGQPSEYPMYLDKRVYQGSSGKVYPIPFTEKIEDAPHVREWQAVHLENAYVRVMVLPELGGRIHIGYDKTTGYDFFYRNNVIKPALVGLAGPWISGGVEFNWPQHHRPATYLPVETEIETDEDGTVTVWCYDHDPFARMSAQHGIRLHADSSIVELVVRVHNRTSERQTFLWWSNVAALVHDDYQSFFPEDVRYVADHARRALTAFPAADRPYYNVDYPALAAEKEGADRIDFYRNIPVPTSYMIVDSQEDFFGGYDHAAGAGFVHWAERRVSPGKKQWTWGNAPFGHAWDDQLTDGDGPYVELMAGVYTDNQPDFTWLLPGETKVFSQYWYPIPAIGPAHAATPDAAVNVERGDDLVATFAVTTPRDGAVIRILEDGAVVAERTVDLRPSEPATIGVPQAAGRALTVQLVDATGRELVAWAAIEVSDEEPWVADEPPTPDQIESVEELYLTGRHLSQYRHPTRSPLTYWEEALRRDAGDARVNTAMAEHAYRAGRYEEARGYVNKALTRLTRRNANPTDAEAYYLSGLIEMRLGNTAAAEQAFGKAGWDATWAAGAGLELARSYARQGKNRAALRVLDELDAVSGYDARRPALRALILTRLGMTAESEAVVASALEVDSLDATLRHLAGKVLGNEAGLLVDVALDLAKAGEVDDAVALYRAAAAAPVSGSGNFAPIAHYLAAHALELAGRADEAAAERSAAQVADRTWAFPAGLDALDALQSALGADENDAVAHHLLGMLYYDNLRRREASEHWDRAIELGLADPVLYRNAGLAAYNILGDDEAAWARYAEAVRLSPEDARLRYEQDQLAQRVGRTTAERLAALRPFEQLVLTRDDFAIEYVELLVAEGFGEEAYAILSSRPFHPWEGGEGKAIEAWDNALRATGRPLTDPPRSLGEARALYVPPAAVREDGVTDYFATSLPELLLFDREDASGLSS